MHVLDVRATLEGMVVVLVVEIVIPALISILSRQDICVPGFVGFLFIGSIQDMFASSLPVMRVCACW